MPLVLENTRPRSSFSHPLSFLLHLRPTLPNLPTRIWVNKKGLLVKNEGEGMGTWDICFQARQMSSIEIHLENVRPILKSHFSFFLFWNLPKNLSPILKFFLRERVYSTKGFTKNQPPSLLFWNVKPLLLMKWWI